MRNEREEANLVRRAALAAAALRRTLRAAVLREISFYNRMRSRRSEPDWGHLRWLVESNLRNQPRFGKNFSLKDKLRTLGQGLFNRNYLFEAGGKAFVLRLAKVERELRTRKEAIACVLREAKTLQALERLEFPYPTPRFISLVREDSEEPVGLIESALDGIVLKYCSNINEPDRLLKIIARVAAAVQKLPKSEFSHLKDREDSRAHAMELLEELPASIFDEFGEAAQARDWILAHLPKERSSTVLHSDLLPQNLLADDYGADEIAVVDWQEARIGDPAYDLAVVTRGVRKPLGVERGLERFVEFYNQFVDQKIPVPSVVVYELLFHLDWLADTVKKRSQKRIGGHAPEHYAELLGSILRRGALRDLRPERVGEGER
jgi:aminoglycoside phosphotransferase (APT) family kinase protein